MSSFGDQISHFALLEMACLQALSCPERPKSPAGALHFPAGNPEERISLSGPWGPLPWEREHGLSGIHRRSWQSEKHGDTELTHPWTTVSLACG